MNFGINLNPILPLRTEPKEQAEMCTQLLFGELFTIVETTDARVLVNNKNDNYQGWADRKMIAPLPADEYMCLANENPAQIFTPYVKCLITNKQESIVLPAGSLIYGYQNEDGLAHIAGNSYHIPTDCLMKRANQPPSGNLTVSMAKSFLNSPYLWGGKTVFGIDCSGLVQLCFGICGIRLPRDAYRQAIEGESITSLKSAKTGDLAFFENTQGKIVHVGIIIADNNSFSIIHSSGKVKIEMLDECGIIAAETSGYSHKLHSIKRIGY